MGSDFEFADDFVGVTSVEVTHIPGPSQSEEFFQDPTSYVLLGILALLAIGVVLFLRNKAS